MAPRLFQMVQRYAPQVVLGAVMLMGLTGIVAFYLALRPCVVHIEPGHVIRYEVTKKIFSDTTEDEERLLREETSSVVFVMLSSDGLTAMIVGPPGDRRPDVRYVEMKRTGQVLLRSDEVTHNYGPSVGYFDFNLMSLPPGLDQAWDAEMHYSYPPPNKRSHNTHIRRTHNGTVPTFRWRYPAIEWVDKSPPDMLSRDGERYVQMQDIVMRYGFDTGRGIWEFARLNFRAGVETPDGLVRHRVEVSLRLIDVDTLRPETLRESRLALAQLHTIQRLMAERKYDVAQDLIREEVWSPVAEIRTVFERWRSDAQAVIQPGDYLIQVGTVPRGRGEALRWQIIADGYPAVIRQAGSSALVYAGPFDARDASILADIRRRFAANKPFWVKVPADE